LEARIALRYKTEREAETIAQAVSPDNVKVPTGLSIKTVTRGKEVFTRIVCEARLRTFVATLDDLLGAVSVAERTLSAVGRN